MSGALIASAPVAATMNPPLSATPNNAHGQQSRFNFGQFVSRPFNFAYVFISCSLIVFFPLPVNRWHIGERSFWMVAAMLGALILVQAFKHLCYIPRPNSPTPFCWGRRAHSGFPSGHTLPAFLLATLVWQSHPNFWFWYLGAALIGWARWSVKAHYGYQIVCSALLGIALGLLAGQFL